MSALRLEVAMCTYNGARYLGEQLATIAAQTRLPDRLVIVDDVSTDATVGIARAFAAAAPFPVDVFINERNLGYARNFERAVGLAGGDVIALADQDDAWVPGKLARIEAELARRPEAGAVFSDAEVVDEALRPLGYRLWSTVGFTRADQDEVASGRAFERLVRGNVVTGATLAFRAEFRDRVFPIPERLDHDAWIALVVAAVAPLVAVAEPLIAYRQHAANQIGARRLTTLGRLRRARSVGVKHLRGRRELCARALRRLEDDPRVAPGRLLLLREAMAHLEMRAALPGWRLMRVGPIVRDVVAGRYRRQAQGWRSAARDLLV
ncbi:MAG TPA: glycosyltransferase family 2 protein [Longimicrobium sp.]